nr:hypothetical protein B0A51_03024 [Rachicladosporium sp. CCFEE 5018]
MSMMRIAVAGTGGLARLIAHYIDDETSHHVMLLSRSQQPALAARGFQISVVDYTDAQSLTFALKGIDTVISTVTGPSQVNLIRAAVAVRVRRFAASEFEGLPSLRPAGDPLDRRRSDATRWLQHYAQNIISTVFVCGIFYERFQPGGLARSLVGLNTGFSGEGDYILDIANMRAQVPALTAEGQPVMMCMTAIQDVARFVTRAIDLPTWPPELRMCGERLSVQNLVLVAQHLKKQSFNPSVMHNPATLRAELAVAAAQGDRPRGIRLQTLIATAEGRYDFTQPNMNAAFPDITPKRFAQWFVEKWDLQ